MPIEIKELHIKVNINQGSNQQSPSANTASTEQASSNGDSDKLVAECVEKVLEILRQRNER